MKTSFKANLPTITWKTMKTACNAVNTTTPTVAPTVREPKISSSCNLKSFPDHAIMPPYLAQELCWLNDSKLSDESVRKLQCQDRIAFFQILRLESTVFGSTKLPEFSLQESHTRKKAPIEKVLRAPRVSWIWALDRFK